MQKCLLLILSVALLAPAAAQAANAQAQEYDELGMSLYRQGLYAKATSYFQNAVQADPTDWQGYENLGNAYFKINDNADALSAYQKSLQINPDNSTLENIVQNLQANAAPANDTVNASTNTSPAAVNPPPSGAAPPTTPPSSVDSEQPIDNGQPNQSEYTQAPPQPGSTLVVRRHLRAWVADVQPTYADGLAAMNHSRGWLDVDLAYNWANQADFFTGAANLNSFIKQNGYVGIASADHGGIEGGAEVGFLLNPYNGIAIGIRGIQSNPYTSNINLQNGGDFETVNVQPYLVPLTLDYYLFLPDHDGRFFITAGVGYYFVVATTDDNFSYDISNGSPSTDEIYGNMYGGSVGFQLGVGREFEIGPRLGLRLFARGRYSKISNINGSFTDADGNYDQYGLMVMPNGGIGADSTSNIGYQGEHYATLDYTGFEFGVGLTFF